MIRHALSLHPVDTAFHAAAYKHVPVLERQLREAVRNNILATENVARACLEARVEHFVFISTDKAVDPVNALGASKRYAEMICQSLDQKSTHTRFVTVRFGNVLASAGSVVPLFREQILRGGPVTVTDPEVTRYFMTIPEACQLILQAAASASHGAIYTLDMGEPVPIRLLAEQMIRLAGKQPYKDVQIIYTGLRPGEKLHETLFYSDEDYRATAHPKVLEAGVRMFSRDLVLGNVPRLREAVCSYDTETIKEVLFATMPEFSPIDRMLTFHPLKSCPFPHARPTGTNEQANSQSSFPRSGFGDAFLPATKTVPKEMLPIIDRPLIQYAVDEAIEAGCDTLVFITNRYKHAVADYFDKAYELEQKLERAGKQEQLELIRHVLPNGVRAIFVTQAEALGLGHAVLCAKAVIGDEPFAVLLPDDLIWNRGDSALKQMADLNEASGASVIAVEDVPHDKTASYGIVATEAFDGRKGRISQIVEKPKPEDAPSDLAVVGRYVLSPKIFELLEQTGSGAGGEIQLTDAIAQLLKTEEVDAYRFEGTRFDCGTHLGLVEATIRFALDNPKLAGPAREKLTAMLAE